MIAYKFLATGAVAPFTGKRWPTPGSTGPGAWLAAEAADLVRYGVHACRAEDLAWWPDDELWVVELGTPIITGAFHVVAARARLLAQVTTWSEEGARQYASACAWRARDLALEALQRARLEHEACALGACVDLVSLQATATSIAGDAPREEPRGLAAYVAGAALRARQGRYPEASLQCAHLGAAILGGEVGGERERAWQSRWLAERLRLSEFAARLGAHTSAV
jgi:hypothetical protein